MATYNGELYVKDQILSILTQLHINDELIISDDTSTDNTISIIKNIHDKRIRLLEDNLFRHPIKNFENALKYATGDYIFLTDQDDIWLNTKYEDCILLLQEYDLVVSDSIVTDENLNHIHPSFFSYFGSKKGIIFNTFRSSYFGSCMAFNKRILKLALPFPDTKEIGHDLWLGLVAEVAGKVTFYNKPLILYRRHMNTSTIAGTGKSTRPLYYKLRGRFIIFKELIRFYYRYLHHGKRTCIHNNTDL